MKRYSELITIPTFEERYLYLKLSGEIGQETFGYSRYLNQDFYASTEWRRLRSKIIVRDNGNDLGCEDRPIFGRIYIHHIVPITPKDILDRSPLVLDPENLISCSYDTHSAITYGNDSLIFTEVLPDRRPDDTILWKRLS